MYLLPLISEPADVNPKLYKLREIRVMLLVEFFPLGLLVCFSVIYLSVLKLDKTRTFQF